MKNKTIAVILAGLMVALTACGNSIDENSSISGSNSESKAAVSAESSTVENSEVSSVADESSDSESATKTTSQVDDTESSADESKVDEAESAGGKVLVAYFSNIQTDGTDAEASAS